MVIVCSLFFWFRPRFQSIWLKRSGSRTCWSCFSGSGLDSLVFKPLVTISTFCSLLFVSFDSLVASPDFNCQSGIAKETGGFSGNLDLKIME